MNSGFPAGALPLDRIETAPVEWAGTIPADGATWDLEEVDLLDAPRVRLRAEDAGEGAVRLSGRLETTVRLACRRCLAGIRYPVELEFDLRFEPAIGPEDESEGVYALDPGAAELDPMPALREELLLDLPAFPVCREECPGLCPDCGVELADGACGCEEAGGDPRWDVLRDRFPQEPGASDDGRGSDDG